MTQHFVILFARDRFEDWLKELGIGWYDAKKITDEVLGTWPMPNELGAIVKSLCEAIIKRDREAAEIRLNIKRVAIDGQQISVHAHKLLNSKNVVDLIHPYMTLRLDVDQALELSHSLAHCVESLDACEHGVKTGEWCEPCNTEYKRARESEAAQSIDPIDESLEGFPCRAGFTPDLPREELKS